jgi:2-methylcitrate dehydratase PrpD
VSDKAGRFPLTAHIAAFAAAARFEDLPEEVVEAGRTHMLDTLGLGLSGAAAPTSHIIRKYLLGLGGATGESRVLGSDMRVVPRFAAFANATAMHVDDFDDTNVPAATGWAGGVHASVSVLAAALAVAEREGASGAELTVAYHVGTEIVAKLNSAMAPQHYENGFHTTGTLNGFGAAAATGRLMRADASAIARAFGLAASQSSGLRVNFGTMAKPFHAGHAAECGVVAAELAALGFTAAENILEADQGFFLASAGGYDESAIIDRLGQPWALIDPGSWLKPFPSGAVSHPGMTLMVDLAAKHDLQPSQIAKVKVITNKRFMSVLAFKRPADATQAKFSLPFGLAAILLRGRAGLAEYTDAFVKAPETQAMIARIEHLAYEQPEAGYSNATTLIEIEMKDGRIIRGRADYGRGSPRRRMSFDDVAEKFRGCADYVEWPRERIENTIRFVRELEKLPDIRVVTAALAR